jgi:hypothetical protein
MRSGRATVGEPARKDDPEKTRAQKKKSDWLVNADLKLIGDPTRIEEPSGATLRSLLIGPSDRRCNLVRAEAIAHVASALESEKGSNPWGSLSIRDGSGYVDLATV